MLARLRHDGVELAPQRADCLDVRVGVERPEVLARLEGASGVDLCRAASKLRDEVILKLLGDASADRSVCPPEEAETLEFLVGKHLIMNHLAFRRDTSDEQVLVRFAVDVGSPERLRMLFVMTAADLGGVGPGVWDSWKEDVLTDLYRRANRHLPRPKNRNHRPHY